MDSQFFIDILSILHSCLYTCRINPLSSLYHHFFLYHMIIPINNPSGIYGFEIRSFGWYFKIGRIFSNLKLRKYLISKPGLIVILEEWFIYWQIQCLELISEIEVLLRHHSYFQHTASSMYHCLVLRRP